MIFSSYQPNTQNKIKALFTETFSASEGESEGLLIGKLVEEMMTITASEDLYGFVALQSEKIIGSIFFSRIWFQTALNAFILSPVAVHPAHQRKGVGQKLINYGIQQLKDDGVTLLFTYGDPAYYIKVGFTQISENMVKAPLELSYPHGWLGQSLVDNEIKPVPGESRCVAALNKAEYW